MIRPLLALCLLTSASAIPKAHAAAAAPASPLGNVSNIAVTEEDDADEPSIPLLDDGVSQQEDDSMVAKKAPPPEFPYPGAREKAFKKLTLEDDPPPKPNPELPRPGKITDDGQFVYSTTPSDSGAKSYGAPDHPSAPDHPIPDVERPADITANGYQYNLPRAPQTGSASMRFGIMSTPAIVNSTSKATYQNIYGNQPLSALFVDREWRLFKKIGRLGLKLGTGLALSSGTGRFADPVKAAQWMAKETFTFIALPNTATLIYRFQYADEQVAIPYVEGGAGYFTFIETRDDNKPPKFGGALTAVASAGLLFSLDFLDRASIRELNSEYGIDHVYLSVEFRLVQNLGATADFTSNIFNAGVVADF